MVAIKPLIAGLLAALVTTTQSATPLQSQRQERRAEQRGTFSTLQDGDMLYVRLRTRSCFGGGCFAFTFQRDSSFSVMIAEVPRSWTAPNSFVGDSRATVFGVVPLSRKDVKGLDALFAWYRTSPGLGCTTVDSVTSTLLRHGKPVTTETFVDGSCGSSDHGEFTLLGELLQRVGGAR